MAEKLSDPPPPPIPSQLQLITAALNIPIIASSDYARKIKALRRKQALGSGEVYHGSPAVILKAPRHPLTLRRAELAPAPVNGATLWKLCKHWSRARS